ncbi:MAG: hypothetical protein K1X54_13285 [Flavobacteriales bacterium]|nr:hypothetical protein [Flavobacteriales bacterium]
MPGIQKIVHQYSSYNQWANQRMIEWLRTLESSLWYQTVPSSFTSIDYTVQHILRTQKFWHAFVQKLDLSNFSWKIFENRAEQTLNELEAQTQFMHQTFCSFEENELTEVLSLNMPWAKNQCSRYEYIIHVINHSTFHRGQVVTQARVLGVDREIPATDYNIFNSI